MTETETNCVLEWQGNLIVINCVGNVYIVWCYWTKLNANIKGRVITAEPTALSKNTHIKRARALYIEDDAYDDGDPYQSDDDARTMIG